MGCGAGGGGTLPRDIIATAQRPDLVILNRGTEEEEEEEEEEVLIFKLTVPWDNNVETAHNLRQDLGRTSMHHW